MDKPVSTWTRKNVEDIATKIADERIERFEQGRNSPTGLGCPSVLGCVAGKRHQLEHDLKWNSDLHNLITFRDAQISENKVVTRQLAEASISINCAANNLQNIIESQKRMEDSIKDNEDKEEKEWDKRDKRIHWYDVRNWAIFAAVILMCIGTVWTTSKLNFSDKENQGSTEWFMIYLASKVSNQPVDEIIKEVKQLKLNTKGLKK